MPYTVYNLPMQRTGFRPYGHSNPWSATQLNGTRPPVWYEHQVIVPFSEGGGRHLGQVQRAFSPRFLHAGVHPRLSGLGQDQGGCDVGYIYDPGSMQCVPAGTPTTSPSGPLGPFPPSQPGEGCADASGAFVMCADPNCRTGGCVTISCPAGQSNQGGYCIGPVTPPISPGPSPRIPVPINWFPPTAGSSTIPRCAPGIAIDAAGRCCQPGQVSSASGVCQSSVASLFSSPWMPLAVVGVVVLAALGGRR